MIIPEELGRIWKYECAPYFKILPRIYLVELRETIKTSSSGIIEIRIANLLDPFQAP
jgi:hypothetical protein